MTATTISSRSTAAQREAPHARRRTVGGPVWDAWREGTLTRAMELHALAATLSRGREPSAESEHLLTAIEEHLEAARDAARPRKPWFPRRATGSRLERGISNLDAAEADLLRLAPPAYLLGQMPSLLNHVQRHLPAQDSRRQEFERIARELGMANPGLPQATDVSVEDRAATVAAERDTIVSIVRGASSAGLREQLRVRSFRNVLIATAAVMLLLAVGLGVLGFVSPRTVPLCFQPETQGRTVVVCPTAQADRQNPDPNTPLPLAQVDELVKGTTRPGDVAIVEGLGLIAAAVAAAAAVRRLRGSSEPHALPFTLAALKLPTGAVTAILGLALMRGGFVPGLSALDTPGQILAWAVLFGYAQQLFTRFVDQQAQTVLDRVRGADKPETASG